ncbi:MAG: hypothetical protein ABFD50_08255 [Smithella sp.]
MAEYIPCVLKREMRTSIASFTVKFIGDGCAHLEPIHTYTEELIPVEMSEFVALTQGKRTLLPGPFKMPQVPQWAKSWFKQKAGK